MSYLCLTMENQRVNIFWFRRDLRIEDNTGLEAALRSGLRVLPLFIFDTGIIEDLSNDDPRISFIHDTLSVMNDRLRESGSSLLVMKGRPSAVWNKLTELYNINAVFANKDYEPYGIKRDDQVKRLLSEKGIDMWLYKDHVIFEEREIVKDDGKPYTVFTPYKNKWLRSFSSLSIDTRKKPAIRNFFKTDLRFPALKETGFSRSNIGIRPYELSHIQDYDKFRDIPSADRTTYLGPHLRFGTVSIRHIVKLASGQNSVFLSELIWREFFMQIMFNFPETITENFRTKYNNLLWRNNENEFRRWCNGETGYPIVDAGMRQMAITGYMHNRVRMIAAGFLCKHLLTDWRLGEAFFASKLNDFELSSNVGNWQWAAGTGCDAAPFFRIFNPLTQQQKYDSENRYISRWLPDYDKSGRPKPVVDHDEARRRALESFRGLMPEQ